MRSAFRDLDAYKRSSAVAHELRRSVARWPAFARWTIGFQLVKAADSVAANIAEACGRWGRADQRRVLLIARGSLYETKHWIATAEGRGLLDAHASERLTGVATALAGLINRRSP